MVAVMNDQHQDKDTSTHSSVVMGSDTSLVNASKVDSKNNRYPHCIVWTPIPCLTWLFPIIGHMGICTTAGIIRDFAGPYFVSEDDMAFGNPVKYWQLDLAKTRNGKDSWDRSVAEASEEYKHRMLMMACWQQKCSQSKRSSLVTVDSNAEDSTDDVSESVMNQHNLLCDNCHSHVAMSLNLMNYNGSSSWNMVKLCLLMLIHGKYINICGFIRTWLPFILIVTVIVIVVCVTL